ncbi:MAG: methionine adenosyltransferase [Sphaerochaeta sp.]|jgi:S-adenosylmethionine synthetase|uniref:S-adenosylmethionine synthase n=1 Tax=Sphaerochaeta associata TaxID=1129264 RepID=A0ABY4DAU6_9SPIR|nr:MULTISPECIES: methionine adenosyltransferase [Sphaerochaeta]MDT3357988.1 methionine adenosyltransferase [Spirochaetota bacterium]MDD2394262.1 methionine adenosyltransferase [Sphaerochaeta sp.]MDD3423349.1 methionine adenosyltransferase [Sphaerochaeta sp.]MDD4037078.1 methionine adenosyltransferase [Sphaerochaeta sp.]MDD4449230.1 methionine adenosyltransferase [Sphaerochaeta sp.]
MLAHGSHIFTSESVSEGHPDKVCDQISDAVLDACLRQDPKSRVACEVFATTDTVIVGGEITTNATLDIEAIVRETVKQIGYTEEGCGFDYKTLKVINLTNTQSADISMGVSADTSLFGEQGAGDQGMMFGFACDETEELMPAPVMWAHQLLMEASRLRKEGFAPFLRPDAKSQVSLLYQDGKPVHIDSVVISHQHTAETDRNHLISFLTEKVIKVVLEKTGLLDEKTKIYINPTGRFVIGGPSGDTGLTGRKIIVDTYGGMGRHGGGAFSGKDPSKVDRSAAYMARFVAKNLVANKYCTRCEVQLSYAIGVPYPISIYVDTFGTGTVDDQKLEDLVRQKFNLSPAGIIRSLDLLRPIYQQNVNYGHFGKASMPWEQIINV